MYQLSVRFDEEEYAKSEKDSFVENLMQTIMPVIEVDWKGKEILL